MHYLLSIIIFVIGLIAAIIFGLNHYTKSQTTIIRAETAQRVQIIQAQAQANQARLKAETEITAAEWPYKLVGMSIVVFGIVGLVTALVWWNINDGRQITYQITHNHYHEQKLIVMNPGQSRRQFYKQLSNNQPVLLSAPELNEPNG